MYRWRDLTDDERKETLRTRKARKLPWHRPPHLQFDGPVTFFITAACYEHKHIIGKDRRRMADFETELLEMCNEFAARPFGWCILPNHYHLLVRTEKLELLRSEIGKLHGRNSRAWNLEDKSIGRKVWHNYFDRDMRSVGHYWATINYIHNNPVHHGYTKQWLDWPFSSAHQYLESFGHEEAVRIWKDYPVLDYGKGWDIY